MITQDKLITFPKGNCFTQKDEEHPKSQYQNFSAGTAVQHRSQNQPPNSGESAKKGPVYDHKGVIPSSMIRFCCGVKISRESPTNH